MRNWDMAVNCTKTEIAVIRVIVVDVISATATGHGDPEGQGNYREHQSAKLELARATQAGRLSNLCNDSAKRPS